MTTALREFDMKALYAVLDAERQSRGLSWLELTYEVNKPFEGTPSIPITVGTLRGIPKKRSVTSAVILQVLAWLDRTPESFLAGNGNEPHPTEVLPESAPGRILRFDTGAIYEALNTKRQELGLTWKQVAKQLPGFTESMLRNLANAPLIGFPRVMLLTQWLGRSAASFVRVCAR